MKQPMPQASRLAPGDIEKHGRVLMYLANNGPSTKYQIEKNIKPKIDHATLHKIVSELKKSASIKVVKEKRSRVGLTMEYYDLTLGGVIGAIQHDDRVSRRKDLTVDEVLRSIRKRRSRIYFKFKPVYGLDLDRLSEKYSSYLPLIFGKSRFLREAGLDLDMLFRDISWSAFHWPYWFGIIVRYNQIHWRDSGPPDAAMVTRNYAQNFGNLMETKPNSRQAKQMLASWERRVRDALYLGFFKVMIAESAWQEPEEILADHKTEALRCDQVWVQDPEIYDWVSKALTNVATAYSERAKWYEERKTQLDSMRNRTDAVAHRPHPRTGTTI